MKPDIHPTYREVVFPDVSEGTLFLTRSTMAASHPFFTGTMKIVDTAGRVERFERRYGRRKQG